MKYLFIILFLFAAIAVRGQSGGDDRGSTLYVKSALYNYSSDFAVTILPLTVDYDKRFSKNWSWVAGFSLTPYPTISIFDDKDVRLYSLNAKVAVTTDRDRRFFIRFEGGFSAVFVTPAARKGASKATRFLPSVVTELHLGVRLGNNIDLLISPLLITPTMYRFSPRRTIATYPFRYHEFNFGSLGLGVRF